MSAYPALKLIHIALAVISISGFAVRGWWMLFAPANLERRWVKVAPHIVDTLFLASGIALLLTLGLPLLQTGWLQAKLVALVAYVVLGSIALRRGRTHQVRIIALVLALAAFVYIVGAALSKSAASWLVWWGQI